MRYTNIHNPCLIVKLNLTATASKNVGPNVGKKEPVKERKRTRAYTPEKVSVKYNNFQSFGSNNPERISSLQSESSTIPITFQPQPTSRFSHTASNTCFQLTAQISSSPNPQITHIKYHQQHHNLLNLSIAAQFLKFDSTMIRTFWASTKIFLLTPYAWWHNLDVNQVVLTLLQLCDNRVPKGYGCQWPLKNGDGFHFPPPYDITAVTKIKKEYRKDGILCEAPPSNVYFLVFHENPFVSPFSCIQKKLVNFRIHIFHTINFFD